MSRPQAETHAAAEHYRTMLGWSVGCGSREVWITMPADLVGLAVPEPLASRLAVHGPAIRYPGEPTYRVFLVLAPRPGDHGPATRLLDAHGVIQLGYRCLVDLPPTSIPTHPLTWSPEGTLNTVTWAPLTWISEPVPGQDLPPFVRFIDQLHQIVADKPSS